MQLSEYFLLQKFLHLRRAEREGLIIYDARLNPPRDKIVEPQYLVIDSVRPPRTLLQTPVRASSGCRVPEPNGLIGGATRSRHLHGWPPDRILSSTIRYNERRSRIRMGVNK